MVNVLSSHNRGAIGMGSVRHSVSPSLVNTITFDRIDLETSNLVFDFLSRRPRMSLYMGQFDLILQGQMGSN